MRKANETLVYQNERLLEQCKSLTLIIVQLTSRLHNEILEHTTDRENLEAENMRMATKLMLYQQQYSVANADWNAKEEELKSCMNEAERLCSQYKQQKLALRRFEIARDDRNAGSHNDQARIQSGLLERERSHFFAKNAQKRDTEDGTLLQVSHLSTQVTLLVAELEKVVKENKELHTKQSRCYCCRNSPRRETHDSDSKAKKHFMNRIQQMEHDQQQVESKRRALLLVNAKLIQDQKQFHVKNVSLLNKVRELTESVNHWRLRDERRRNIVGQPRWPPKSKARLPLSCVKKGSTRGLPIDTIEQRAKNNGQKISQESLTQGQISSHESSAAGLRLPQTRDVDVFIGLDNGTCVISSQTTSASLGKRKHKQEEQTARFVIQQRLTQV
ncbi:unnamed protein product [Peronospora belbahrii]|uniref:Uncharacterized protein n=1 Tax=Peronospora belbahrii TaxID=622444 RepID=A0AAU9L5L9_9STRA|nr:unnamed protein product [Peronospora belbahrii]